MHTHSVFSGLSKSVLEREILRKYYWIRQTSRVKISTIMWDDRQTGVLETGQTPAFSCAAWQMSVCLHIPGLAWPLSSTFSVLCQYGGLSTLTPVLLKSDDVFQSHSNTVKPGDKWSQFIGGEPSGKQWTWEKQNVCSEKNQMSFRILRFLCRYLVWKRITLFFGS